jgi:hypothetical protein
VRDAAQVTDDPRQRGADHELVQHGQHHRQQQAGQHDHDLFVGQVPARARRLAHIPLLRPEMKAGLPSGKSNFS